MAEASGITAGITAGIGAAGGIAKFFEGRKMQQKANAFIENFEWQDLKNSFEDVQVSTLGSDLRREEAGRTTATSVDAVRSGGQRSIIGGLGRVQAQNNLVNKEIAANLDEQQKRLDYAAAQDDQQIRAMTEQRQAQELQGYGQMANVGMNMKYGGIADMLNTAGFASQLGGGGGGATQTPTGTEAV